MVSKVWDEITYQFTNVYCVTVEVWVSISNFHLTHCNGCDYLSMQGLKLNNVSKRGLWEWNTHHDRKDKTFTCLRRRFQFWMYQIYWIILDCNITVEFDYSMSKLERFVFYLFSTTLFVTVLFCTHFSHNKIIQSQMCIYIWWPQWIAKIYCTWCVAWVLLCVPTGPFAL